jgi:tRNA A-37 threonylcarbamoyl transferase component Bud32
MIGEKATTTCAVGEVLSHYRILEKIGSGGMGDVFRARDEHLDRDVAIKVLPPKTFALESSRRHFRKEAVTLSNLNHPNIATIYDFDTKGEIDFLVMEYIPGITLSEKLALGSLPEKDVINLGIQLAEGLSALHEYGVIHRDLKPRNLRLTSDGRLKILDFGLAMLHRPLTENATTESTVDAIAGTLVYMAPEQVLGSEVDERTDIHAAGCVLYELITGQQPFAEVGHSQLIAAILHSSPTIRDSCISSELKRMIEKCLETDPENRYQSARELSIDLRRLQAGAVGTTAKASEKPFVRRRLILKLLAAAVGALILLGMGVAVMRKTVARPLPASYQQLTFRRGTVISAKFAGNGQIIYSAAWDGRPPEVFITGPKGRVSTSTSVHDADVQSVSPSDEVLLVLNRVQVHGNVRPGALARMSLTGVAPRPFLEGVQEADWGPEGRSIAVTRYVGQRSRLEYPIGKVLYEIEGGYVSHPRVSRDGTLVAFLDHPNLGDDMGFVAVVDLQGKKQVLSQQFVGIQTLQWNQETNELWFSATRTGEASQLYAVNLHGRMRTVARAPSGLQLLDVGPDGRALIADGHLHASAMALGAGQKQERDLSVADWSLPADISDDGNTLLVGEQTDASGEYSTYIRKTDGSPAVRLGGGLALALSPDGQWALALSQTKPMQLILLPTGVGQPRAATRDALEHYDAAWLPDSRHIVFVGAEPGRHPRIYLQELSPAAPPHPISPEGVDGHIRCSPTGKLSVSGDRIWLVPLDGHTPPRVVPGTVSGDDVVGWSPDEHSLYVQFELTGKLFRVDLSTGKREFVRQFGPADPAGVRGIVIIRVTPDLRAYSYGINHNLNQLYLVDGLK